MSIPQVSWLPDGRRLHMNHGPIDLIVEAFGDAAEVRAAYRQAAARFRTILEELVAELPELRRPSGRTAPRRFAGTTAQRMEHAVVPLARRFITPMAAVAGAVADEMLAAMVAGRRLEKAYVNDGGDVAIHLAPGAEMKAAIAGTAHGVEDRITLRSEDAVRGMATSGWRGRSFSLGVADAVTVLARSAAEADAAATIIANAVDLPGHPAVERRPARDLAPDSDLGSMLVTTDVGALSATERAQALDAGLAAAEDLRQAGLIEAAALFLGQGVRVCGGFACFDQGRSVSLSMPPPSGRSPSGFDDGALSARSAFGESAIGGSIPALVGAIPAEGRENELLRRRAEHRIAP